MKLAASHIYQYYRPTKCNLRITLREKGVKEGPASPFEEVLETLGQRHEKNHLMQFPSFVDLSKGNVSERTKQTKEAIQSETPVIYHGLLKASTVINGISCEVIGEPDYLLREEQAYIIQDSKLSRRITEKDHPEIFLQMCLYGWLFRQNFGVSPKSLQVHAGTGEIVEISFDEGNNALSALKEILTYRQVDSEPYSPVGWSKCNSCCFFEYCWPKAEGKQDVAIVFGIDQNLAISLRNEGVETIPQLIESFDEQKLNEFKRPYGKGMRKVGKNASSILRMANAIMSEKETILQEPDIPESSNYVMFDLEGLPPYLDEIEKIYLWGLQIFGESPSEFMAATAGTGSDGDQQGWNDFLEKAKSVFQKHGDIPFVHWHHYERNFLDKYIERFGDKGGIAMRVRENLVDLLPITRNSIALPVPSYSLKVIEKYVGFERSQDEYGGNWAMAKYIEAIEMEDENQRQEILDQILIYNKEDLEATWAVFQWLKSKFSL